MNSQRTIFKSKPGTVTACHKDMLLIIISLVAQMKKWQDNSLTDIRVFLQQQGDSKRAIS